MSSSAAGRASNPASANPAGTSTLESLARAARQMSLYGPEHPIAASALAEACKNLASHADGGRLQLRAQHNALLCNGETLQRRDGNVARFHAAMRQRFIAAINIDASVHPPDLARLLLLLAEDTKELTARGGAQLAFGADRPSSIHIEEVDFTGELLASEAAWRHLRRAMEGDGTGALRGIVTCCLRSLKLLADQKALARIRAAQPKTETDDARTPSSEEAAAAAVARLIQEAGETARLSDQRHWQTWRTEMVPHLAGLTPQARSRIFRSPSGASSRAPDMLALIAQEMEPHDCVSMVLDHPDSIHAERSEGLALALRRVMSGSSRSQMIERLLHEEALSRDIPEEVYQNVVGMLISEAAPAGEEQLASPRGAWSREEPPARGPTSDLDDLLQTTQEDSLRRSRIAVLLDALHAELSVSQFGTALSLLAKAAADSAQRGDTAQLLAILSGMREATKQKPGQDPAHRAMAASTLARSGTKQVVACIGDAFAQARGETRAETIALLGSLGEEGIAGLVAIVERGDDSDLEAALRTVMEADDPGLPHLRQVLFGAGKQTLHRIMMLLIETEDAGASIPLGILLGHAGEQTRLELIHLIRESRRAHLAQLLPRLLSDSSPRVREAAVDALADLRPPEAVSPLCDLVRRESDFGDGVRLKHAAIRALDAIGSGAAVPVLCEVLLSGGLLSAFGGAAPRAAAAEALGKLGGPDARQALQRGAKSLRPTVRAACRRALVRLRAADGRVPIKVRHVR